MNSPNRHFDFDPENLPVTPDGNFPLPNGPVIRESMISLGNQVAAPDSSVAAAAAAAPSYYLDVSEEQRSPSREELEGFYRELGTSGSIRRSLFPVSAAIDYNDKDLIKIPDKFNDGLQSASLADAEEALAAATAGASAAAAASKKNKKRKKPTKKKGKKRHRKRGGGKKKYKKKRTKKKSRRRKRRTKRRTKKRRKKKKRKTRR